MPKFVDSDVLDLGINRIKTNAIVMHLIKAYVIADAYATVVANSVANVAMVSTDHVLASAGNNRTLTTAAGKTSAATGTSTQYDSGTATAGAATTLTDTAKTFVVNAHAARAVNIVSGTGAGQARRIASNTATVLTVDTAWVTNPDITSVYRITDDLHIAFVDSAASKVLWVTDETSNQVVTAGNTVNYPSLVYTSNQPT